MAALMLRVFAIKQPIPQRGRTVKKFVFNQLALGAVTLLVSSQGFAGDVKEAVNQYVAMTNTIEKAVTVLKDAGKCPGDMGKRIAARMDDSLKGLRTQRTTVLAEVKKGAAGRAKIDAYAEQSDRDNEMMNGNLMIVKSGLGGNDPACVKASKAFQVLYDSSLPLPGLLRRISSAL